MQPIVFEKNKALPLWPHTRLSSLLLTFNITSLSSFESKSLFISLFPLWGMAASQIFMLSILCSLGRILLPVLSSKRSRLYNFSQSRQGPALQHGVQITLLELYYVLPVSFCSTCLCKLTLLLELNLICEVNLIVYSLLCCSLHWGQLWASIDTSPFV